MPALAPLPPPRPVARPLDEAVAAHLAQGELELATAALLPLLESGGAIERQAAVLVRQLLARSGGTVPGPVPAEHHLAGALRRMTDLLQDQEQQIVRLEAMLDGLV